MTCRRRAEHCQVVLRPVRQFLQQDGLRLVRLHDALELGALEFGDGRGACGRDREQNVRREIVDAVGACVAEVGSHADGDHRGEDSGAAVEDKAREEHARQ
jgi:hypothetical protein